MKKFLTYALLTLGISGTFLTIPCNAQTTDTSTAPKASQANTTEEYKNTIFNTLDSILKLIYMILWPLLWIAGISMDNSLVYGSFLHLDAPLRSFWNMCKNFANFALGFMLLRHILKNIFSLGEGKEKPADIIKKVLITGVAIQASRFLMAALIDLSTVATYSVGAMPLNLMKSDSAIQSRKFLELHIKWDASNIKNQFSKTYVTKFKVDPKANDDTAINATLAPCLIKTFTDNNTYIIGRSQGGTKYENKDVFGAGVNACVKNENQIYIFKEIPIGTESKENYTVALTKLISEKSEAYLSKLTEAGFIINLNAPPRTTRTDYKGADITEKTAGESQLKAALTTYTNSTTQKTYGVKAGEERLNGPNVLAQTLGDIMSKAGNFVGPLGTLYNSLLSFASLADTTLDRGAGQLSGEMLIKTLIAVALILPLLALGIVLIMRIGILRAVIATSPLIILANQFGVELKDKMKYFEFKNIIGIIFAPVVTVFAMSISLVFMSALTESFSVNNGNKPSVFSNLGIDQVNNTDTDSTTYREIAVFGQHIKYPISRSEGVGQFGDRFSWLVVCLLGVGVMWFIVFAAIKSNELGKSVGEKVQKFGENMLQTAPIIPMPQFLGGKGASMKGLGDTIFNEGFTTEARNKTIKLDEQERRAQDAVEAALPNIMKDEKTADTSLNSVESERFLSMLNTGNIESSANYIQAQKINTTKPEDITIEAANGESINLMTHLEGLGEVGKKQRETFAKALGNENLFKEKDALKKLDTAMTTQTPDQIKDTSILTNLPNNHTVTKDNKMYKLNDDKTKFEIQPTTPSTPTTKT